MRKDLGTTGESLQAVRLHPSESSPPRAKLPQPEENDYLSAYFRREDVLQVIKERLNLPPNLPNDTLTGKQIARALGTDLVDTTAKQISGAWANASKQLCSGALNKMRRPKAKSDDDNGK